jgi:hypothetical protein
MSEERSGIFPDKSPTVHHTSVRRLVHCYQSFLQCTALTFKVHVMVMTYQTIRCHTPEDDNMNFQHRRNLISRIKTVVFEHPFIVF